MRPLSLFEEFALTTRERAVLGFVVRLYGFSEGGVIRGAGRRIIHAVARIGHIIISIVPRAVRGFEFRASPEDSFPSIVPLIYRSGSGVQLIARCVLLQEIVPEPSDREAV